MTAIVKDDNAKIVINRTGEVCDATANGSPTGITVRMSGGGTTGHVTGVNAAATNTSDSQQSGGPTGVQGYAYTNAGFTVTNSEGMEAVSYVSGTAVQAFGLYATVAALGASGLITSAYGIFCDVISSLSGAAITNAYAFYGKVRSYSSGVITNAYGLYLEAVTAGATLNYAIYSAGGKSYHAGNFSIGTTGSTSPLTVASLPAYANNAAAISGGLTAGAFYRTGGDPDLVCVVH